MDSEDSIERWEEAHKAALNMPLSTDPSLPTFAMKFLRADQRNALEVGSGLGIVVNVFVLHGFKVTGIDMCPFAVATSQQRFPALKFHHSRAQEISNLFSREFDLVYTVAVLQHSVLHRKREIIEQIKLVLKDDGLLLTAESCGGGHYPDNYDQLSFHPYVLTKTGWVKFMAECNMEPVACMPNNKDYVFLWKSTIP